MKSETHPQAFAKRPPSEHPPTVTFSTEKGGRALPYLHLRMLELEEDASQIRIDHDRFEILIRGERLEKLWDDLCAFRVVEVMVDGHAGRSADLSAGRSCVTGIEIRDKEEEPAGV